MSNPVTDLQGYLAGILEADPMFENIPVLTEKIDDIEGRIDIAVGKTNGICAVVLSPLGVVTKGRQNQPLYFDPISVVVRTFEKPVLNSTGFRALDVAIKVCLLLHLRSAADGIMEPLVSDGYRLGNDPKWFCYDSAFTTRGGVVDPLPVVADPVVSSDGAGNVTISQATAHAFTWYSVDERYPSPRTGTFYGGTFAATMPALVKARSWLPGHLPSNLVKTQLAA